VKVQSEVTVGPGEEVKVPFSVEIPANADNGGYFGAIFLNTTPPSTEGESQVSVGAKVGVLLFMRVGQNIKEEAGVIEFKTIADQKFYTTLPVNMFYRFRNSGGDRVKPQGDVKIYNIFGAKTASFDANPQQGNILPMSIRRFELTWGAKDLAPNSFLGIAMYQMKHFACGRYKADLVLTYGSANQIVNNNFTFWIIPWQLLSLVIGILLFGFIIIRFLLKKYNRWVIAQARASMR
jgi:hypothetical protein